MAMNDLSSSGNSSEKSLGKNLLKHDISAYIASIDDEKLLLKVKEFLDNQKKLSDIKNVYGDTLYDSLNEKVNKKLRNNEVKVYKKLTNLLKEMSEKRKKNKWISKKDWTLFDVNEPEVQNILDKSLLVKELWLKNRITHLSDLGIHVLFIMEWAHYSVRFNEEENKLESRCAM